MLTPSHRDNLVRWTPDLVAGHYESHFIKVNLVDQAAAFWWKFTILQPLRGRGPAAFEVWAIFFDTADPAQSCAAKERFGAERTLISRDRLLCRYGDNVLEHDGSSGAIGQHPRFEWDLHWTPPEHAFRHFHRDSMYQGGFPKTKLLTPTPSSPFTGRVRVGERTFELAGAPGMQGHNWGLKHAESWVWVHCNAFEGESATCLVEGASSRLRLGPALTPPFTLLRVDDGVDEPLTVNGWVDMLRTESALDGLRWRFRGTHGTRSVEGVFRAGPERFVGVNYEDPDGTITHCLNSKIADGEVRILHRNQHVWRLHRTLRSRASAALEIGLKQETHGVRIHLE